MNMRHLVLNDFRLHRLPVGINLIFPTLYLVFLYFYAKAFVVGTSTLFAAVLPLILILHEEKFNVMALSCSLPVSRRTVVRARYLSAWLLMGAALLYFFSLAVLFRLIAPSTAPTFARLFTLRGCAVPLFIVTLVYAGFLPAMGCRFERFITGGFGH